MAASSSNIGYGDNYPNSNVNQQFLNVGSSNYSAGLLGSRQIPSSAYSMAGASSNINAAAGTLLRGGGITNKYKSIKNKIKNITKRYKMPKKSKRIRITRLKRKIRSRASRSKSRARSVRTISRKKNYHMRGGYSQYGSNMPHSNSYSVGGLLTAGTSMLASPPPIQSNGGSCVDNLNHFTNKGFSSPGH